MTRWLYTIVMFLLLVGAVFAVNGRFSPAASVPQVNADSDHLKISICHFDGGSGKYSSIDINITSISDCTTAGGHDGHANDIIPAFTFSTCVYPGKNLSMVSWIANNCSQPLTPTPTQGVTPTPTVNPSATPTPTGVQPTVTPTPTNAPTATPTVGPTATPTPTGAPTATPTPTSTPSNGGNSGGGSGGGDGRSDGLSSCPQCTQAPHQQGVLGASTMADTGSFEQNLMNIFTVLGVLTMSTAGMLYKKTRQESLA